MVQDNADGYFIDDSTGPMFPEDSQRAGQQLHFHVVQAEIIAVKVGDQLGHALLARRLSVPTTFEAGAATLAALVAIGRDPAYVRVRFVGAMLLDLFVVPVNPRAGHWERSFLRRRRAGRAASQVGPTARRRKVHRTTDRSVQRAEKEPDSASPMSWSWMNTSPPSGSPTPYGARSMKAPTPQSKHYHCLPPALTPKPRLFRRPKMVLPARL